MTVTYLAELLDTRLFIPTGVAHSARNVGDGKASELATYIATKGSPQPAATSIPTGTQKPLRFMKPPRRRSA